MATFNLSLDDFSPHPRAGLDFKVIDQCNRLIEKYPEIKINLFTPAAYCRLGEEPCFLSDNMEWVARAKDLPDNYRINLHGLYHRRTGGKHPVSNNDEWQFLNYDEAKHKMVEMVNEFKVVGLKFYNTFRPPGWKISISAARALTEKGAIIAGNEEYFNRISPKVSDLKWVSYNWDITSPCKIKGDVIAYGHTSDWTNNYMDDTRYNLVDELLMSDNFEFKFIEEMV